MIIKTKSYLMFMDMSLIFLSCPVAESERFSKSTRLARPCFTRGLFTLNVPFRTNVLIRKRFFEFTTLQHSLTSLLEEFTRFPGRCLVRRRLRSLESHSRLICPHRLACLPLVRSLQVVVAKQNHCPLYKDSFTKKTNKLFL